MGIGSQVESGWDAIRDLSSGSSSCGCYTNRYDSSKFNENYHETITVGVMVDCREIKIMTVAKRLRKSARQWHQMNERVDPLSVTRKF